MSEIKQNVTEKAPDRRVLRTKHAIQQAYLELLEEKPLAQIKVSELAERADINRKTFYAYYDGIEALHNALEDEVVSHYETLFRSINLNAGKFDAVHFFRELNALIAKDRHILHLLNKLGMLSHLFDKVQNLLIEIFQDSYSSKDEKKNARYMLYLKYASAGILNTLSSWIHDPQGLTDEDFTDLVVKITLRGFRSV
jgi:AcrR family transcriptional regulator